MLIIFCHICAKVNSGSMVGWQKLPMVEPCVHDRVHALVFTSFRVLNIFCEVIVYLFTQFMFLDFKTSIQQFKFQEIMLTELNQLA